MKRQRSSSADKNRNYNVKRTKCNVIENDLLFPNEPYSSVYNLFQRNDLVFGLRSVMNEVHYNLRSAGFTKTRALDLNTNVLDYFTEEYETSARTPILSSEEKSHYSFLRNFRNYLLSERIDVKPSEIESLRVDRVIVRACKLLINKRGPETVHFQLEGLDYQRVCDKEIKDPGITNSELRSAFRSYLKKGPNPHLFFYNKKQELTDPPWLKEKHRAEWKLYKDHLEKKKGVSFKF